MSPEMIGTLKGAGCFGTAMVLGGVERDERLRVQLEDSSDHGMAWIPMSLGCRPRAGDRILVAGDNPEDLHVLAVLQSASRTRKPVESVETREGARAEVDDATSGSSIRVFSNDGNLLFEYDAAADNATVCMQAENVEFRTRGDLAFSSGGSVRLSGREVHMDAARGRVAIDELDYSGKRFVGVLDRSKLLVGRLETVAKTVSSTARNVYQKVTGLKQLRTRRMRTLVETSYHLKSERANLKTEEEFKVDGKEILLG